MIKRSPPEPTIWQKNKLIITMFVVGILFILFASITLSAKSLAFGIPFMVLGFMFVVFGFLLTTAKFFDNLF